VLAHNTIPHGHFDELFTLDHGSDSNNHCEHNSHDHHFLFSHSISLHVTIEKQISFSIAPSKAVSKSLPVLDFFCFKPDKHFFTPPDSFCTLSYVNPKSPTQTLSSKDYNRGPPVSL
jgi:hypothetical protein